MKLKDKYFLSIKGHIENNTDYYEENNKNYSINCELLLQKSIKTIKIGHKIEIIEVYDDYVELLIDNEKQITLKPNETKFIVSKNQVSGNNENFKIDKEILYVELSEIDFSKLNHLQNYKDYKVQIDENISKLKYLLSNQKSYFEIQKTLKTLLFKLTDSNYNNRIKNLNNIEAIDEIEKLMPYKEIIEETINCINLFKIENDKIIKAIITKKSFDIRDFKLLSDYLYHLAECRSSYDSIPFNILEDFLDVVLNSNEFESDYDYTLLNYYLTIIVSRHRYYFNHAYIAHRLAFNIKYVSLEEFSKHELYNMMMAAGDLLLMQYKRKDAMECYYEASNIALANNDILNSAYALQKYYRINSQFPDNLKINPDINQINKTYKEHAPIVLSGINYKGLKIDEVEFTDKFVSNYKYVMMSVENEIDIVGDLHTPYQRWNLMQKYYLEMFDIAWKTPKQMNPKIMFD